jgi:hypothetical protein
LDDKSAKLEPWHLTGTVQSLFSIERRMLHFPEAVIGEPVESKEIRLESLVEINNLQATSKGADVVVQALEHARYNCKLVVRPHSPTTVGLHDFRISLSGATMSGRQVTVSPIALTVEAVGDLYALPSKVILGNRFVGETVEGTFSIVSRRNRRFSIQSMNVDTLDTRLQDHTWIEPKVQHACRFAVRCTKPGVQSTVIKVLATHEDEGEEKAHQILCELIYCGLERGVL